MSRSSLALYDLLIGAGLKEEPARQLAQLLATDTDLEHLATKSDISDLKIAIAEVKAEILKWQMVMLAPLYFGIVIALLRWLVP